MAFPEREPYIVKSSPGHGLGVFATKALEAGMVIVWDEEKMNLPRNIWDCTEEGVTLAFHKLSTEDQETYLQLHEGDKPYKSKLMRIFKSNGFGDEKHGYIYLKISRINHSCAPNAEVVHQYKSEGSTVVAVKPIAKDEEVRIDYAGPTQQATRACRAEHLQAAYGFVCKCEICSLTGLEGWLSDARRVLISALAHKQAGLECVDVTMGNTINGLMEGTGEEILMRKTKPLAKPLTPAEKVTYNSILASLYEAEGITCYSLAQSHIAAAIALIGQVLKEKESTISLDAARVAVGWFDRGIQVMIHMRGRAHDEVKELHVIRGAIGKRFAL